VTGDLVERLRAKIDEAEAIARAADAGPRWSARVPTDGPVVDIGEEVAWSREIDYAVWRCEDEQDGCPEVARGYAAEARHIAANDPAHVLRTIQAHRKIIERHKPRPLMNNDGVRVVEMQCSACVAVDEIDWFNDEIAYESFPCDDVLALASIYFPEGTEPT
jgi:hypothetical protein